MSFPKLSMAAPVLAMSFLLLCSCSGMNSGGTITAMRPADLPSRKELKRELSTINLSMQISTGELAQLLDRTVPKELYSGAVETARLSVKVVRNGRLGVRAAANAIHLSIPISVSFSFGMFETLPLATTIDLTMAPRLRQDWSFDAGVTYTALSDTLPSRLHVGPLEVKPRILLSGLVEPLQRTLSARIGSRLNEKFQIKAEAEKVWRQAQKPVRLDRDHSAWLVLSPKDVFFSPLLVQGDQLKFGVGVRCFAEVTVGPQPIAPPPVTLPSLQVRGDLPGNFRVALNSELYYRDLLRVVSPLLLNKEFREGSRSVTIRGLDLYGNGDLLVIRVDTAGSVDGTVYLTCRPVFDQQRNKLSVEDVEFDLQTRDLLVRSAEWLLHSSIREAVQERMNVDLTQRLVQARELTGQALARVKLGEDLYLTGNIQSLKLGDLVVQKDRISVQVVSEGETTILFH